MIAFMKYDLFPYFIWNEIIEVSGGASKLKSYGWYNNRAFIAVLTDEVAKEKIAEIKAILDQRINKLKQIDSDSLKELSAICWWAENK